MNGKVAKNIRKMVYGLDGAPRFRKYTVGSHGECVSDNLRNMYKKTKRNYNRQDK